MAIHSPVFTNDSWCIFYELELFLEPWKIRKIALLSAVTLMRAQLCSLPSVAQAKSPDEHSPGSLSQVEHGNASDPDLRKLESRRYVPLGSISQSATRTSHYRRVLALALYKNTGWCRNILGVSCPSPYLMAKRISTGSSLGIKVDCACQ